MENIFLTIFRNATGKNKNLAGRRFSAFFICVLLAVFSWMLIVLTKDYTLRFRFKTTYINLPEGKAVVNLLPDSMEMNIIANGFSMLNLKWFTSKRNMVIDCSVMKLKKDSTFYVSLNAVSDKMAKQINSDARIISVAPDTLFFSFSKSAKKKVPVKLISAITFAKQFQLSDSIKTEPSEIEIFGAEDEIKNITFIETQPLTLKSLNKTAVKKLGFSLANKLIGTSTDSVTVTVPVDEFTEGETEVAVSVINLPTGFTLKIIPDKIKVKYKVSINNLNKVNDVLFRVVADYSEIDLDNSSKLKIKLVSSPSFITSVKLNPEKVEYIIRK